MAQDLGSSQSFSKNTSENLTENLSKLRNHELHIALQARVAEERKLLHQILLLIIEIDQRKLYLPMACSSLFAYLVTLIGYSPANQSSKNDQNYRHRQRPWYPQQHCAKNDATILHH